MILPSQKDAIHRGQMYRLLIEIADNPVLSKNLIFKGGTCAALLGRLDRFSVDLDFDVKANISASTIKTEFNKLFKKLNLRIDNENRDTIQYILKYKAPESTRNTLKIDAVDNPYKSDVFEPSFLVDIERYLICQTVETQFAHKLVAVLDRYKKHRSIAGRDIYDIHYFFLNQYRFNEKIITERTELTPEEYIQKLSDFIKNNITQTIISEDINMLLPYEKFSVIRKSLKPEVLAMLKNRVGRHGG